MEWKWEWQLAQRPKWVWSTAFRSPLVQRTDDHSEKTHEMNEN